MNSMMIGNASLLGCILFYLAWWLVAFHPVKAIKGFRSGWLLLPAFGLGIFGVCRIVLGIKSIECEGFLNNTILIVSAILVYFFLLWLTGTFFHRQVTTELFLIVGWGLLCIVEINTMHGLYIYSFMQAILFCILVIILMIVSLVCYVLYYGLDKRKGYIDGMIPLILAFLVLLALNLSML